MQETNEVWYRNPDTVISTKLDNPDFKGQFDLRPYIDFNDGTMSCPGTLPGGAV
jgi:hypothetical protein